MFRIKICGITNVEDALVAAEAGADAIGLNFYEKSPRYVQSADARAITNHAGGGMLCIGVFVNREASEIDRIITEANLDGLQFHGDEPPELVAYWAAALQSPSTSHRSWDSVQAADVEDYLPPLVIRAHRFGVGRIEAIRSDLDKCRKAGCLPGAVLVDAATTGLYGGTGETLPWGELAGLREQLAPIPLILAGGLTPENVAEAIRLVKPFGVDVASGVESSPGKKDPAKVRDFIAAAKAAFAAIEGR